MAREVFISVDIEASGPAPGLFSMLALGACVVGKTSERFYAELKPTTEASVPEAMAVVGRTLEEFREVGREPIDVMKDFGAWVERASSGKRPVFVGFNAPFDWSFVNWYFTAFGRPNPFGVGGLDIKAFYMGMAGCAWDETRSSRLPEKYRSKAKHAHHALLDAVEQADVFERMARDAGVLEKL